MTDPDVVVRPDGMITLPLLNDVTAAGLRPEQLRDRLAELSKKTLLGRPPGDRWRPRDQQPKGVMSLAACRSQAHTTCSRRWT